MAQISRPEDKITFSKTVKSKKKAIGIVNKSLKKYGNLGAYGNLTMGLNEIAKENSVSIEEHGTYYHITIWPDSQAGHDFAMAINKTSLKIYDVVVGEVEPQPVEPAAPAN